MTQIKNIYTLIAREVSTDSNDNMNSIIKIIDKFSLNVSDEQLAKEKLRLGVDKHIAFPATYSIATSWIFENELKKEASIKFQVSIVDPEGKDLGGPEQSQQLPVGVKRVNINLNVQGLPITLPGNYTLYTRILSTSGKLLAEKSYPFEVDFAGPQIKNQ